MPEDKPHTPSLQAWFKRLNFWDKCSLALFIITAFIALNTFSDYGMSWDEHHRYRGGEEKLAYYHALLGRDVDVPVSTFRDKYPGFFDLPLAILTHHFGFNRFYTGHLMSTLFGLLGIGGTWLLARHLGGSRAAALALLFIITMPRYYGHMFFNPKDIPFAALHILSLYLIIKTVSALPGLSRPLLYGSAVCIGCFMATRIGGVLAICYLALGMGIYLLWWLWQSRPGTKAFAKRSWEFLLYGVGLCLVALLALLPWWPAAHGGPLAQASHTLTAQTHFGWQGVVFFEGYYLKAADLPWYYMPKMFLMTTPEHILALLLIGAVILLLHTRGFFKHLKDDDGLRKLPLLLTVFAGFFPLAYILIKDAIVYDGIRHLLFLLPVWACLAALALDWLAVKLSRVKEFYSRLSLLVPMALSAIVAVQLYGLHPYQYVYYNTASGGLEAAFGINETDYWGTSYREAVERLDYYLQEQTPEGETPEPVYVSATGIGWLYKGFAPDYFKWTKNPKKAEFFISMTRVGLHTKMDGEALFYVTRAGIPLAVVKDRRALLNASTDMTSDESD